MANKEEAWGNWDSLKGKVKEKWGELTDDDLMRIEGRRDQLIGALERRYGYAKERAEKDIELWEEQELRSENVARGDRR